MFFRKILLSMAAATAMLMSSASFAGVYKIEFVASNFVDMAKRTTGHVSPYPEITGSFLIRMADIESLYIDEILDASLTIDGFSYQLGDMASGEGGEGVVFIGGLLEGVDAIAPATNDFWFWGSLDPAHHDWVGFAYAMESATTAWRSRAVEYTVTEVPEPVSVGLFLLGLGGLAAARRRAASIS